MTEQLNKEQQWKKLLSLKKAGDTKDRDRLDQDETRLGYEVDYDRIVFSEYFRSLQDKTQVIPLSKTDFVHTRLTHSMEVSVVGRSLGRKVGKHLLNKYPTLKQWGYQINDFGAIVAAAALCHDIGNPPFGHSGEKAIGDYFKNGAGQKFQEQMSALQWEDLVRFEGNANGFKIITEGHSNEQSGLRLSYATLGAFMKYPKSSYPHRPSLHISDKKFGFFDSECSTFTEIASDLGLISKEREAQHAFYRHPLAYLVEAADDICYTIIDFEDGINLGFIDEAFALEYLIKLVKDVIDTSKYNQLKTKKERISYLRALAIGALISEAIERFIKNEEAILNGEFDQSLLDKCKYEAQINDILKISVDNIYKSRVVVEREITGYKAIQSVLNQFIQAKENYLNGEMQLIDKLVFSMLPSNLQKDLGSTYKNILGICSYVAGMTDSNLLGLYKKFQGILY